MLYCGIEGLPVLIQGHRMVRMFNVYRLESLHYISASQYMYRTHKG